MRGTKSDGARTSREESDTSSYQPEWTISPVSQQNSHSGIHCDGGSKHGERTSDDEEEKDDRMCITQSFGYGHAESRERQRWSFRSATKAVGQNLQSSFFIDHTIECPVRIM